MIRDPRGDCDDLSLLFISMCRSQCIPAYLQADVVFSDSIRIDKTDWNGHYHYVFEGAGWHAWVMVYIPPWGWLPVDLTMLGGMNPVETIT
jgi:transglutaminase-like putative cysteine protease